MPNYFQIPIKAGAPQRFSITLGGTEYRLTLRYLNVTEGGWVLDIADASGAAILLGIPLITGADLLAQYKYLGLGGRLWVQTTKDPDAVPTFDNLGDGAYLYWVTD